MAGFHPVFVVGLLVGGLLGGWGILLLQQIRSGRVKIPPKVSLGPIKVDLSALSPATNGDEPVTDWSGLSPAVQVGGSLTGGCLSLIAAAMIFVGFVLPWASFDLILFSGTMSGLSVLVQLIVGLLLALLGTFVGGIFGLREGSLALGAAGGLVTIILLLAVLFLFVIPLMGYRIGRVGVNILQSPQMSDISQTTNNYHLRRAALIGLVPVLCYFITASGGILQQVSALGVSINNAERGLWITLGGFAIALIAGLVVSITASLANQIRR